MSRLGVVWKSVLLASRRVAVAALVTCAAWAGSSAVSQAQSVTLFERVRYDLFNTSASSTNAAYIGTNPAAVAWDSGKLYIAGNWSGTAASGTTAIVQVLNPLSTPGLNITPTFSAAFNQRSTTSTRGYSGLALSGTVLASAWFGNASLSSPIVDGIKSFNTSNNSLMWTGSLSAANIGGVAFDPGYTVSGSNQGGAGITGLYYGSGRRQLFDTTSGTLIYGPSPLPTNGMIINTSPASTEWRDIDFDPATGNMFSRARNDVAMGIRTGSNTIANAAQTFLVSNGGNGGSTAGQNLTFMGGVSDAAGSFSGDVLMWNDRPATASTNGSSVYTSTMKLVTTSSASVGINWNMLSGSTPVNGNGWYDMDYDPTTKSVAIVDFQNRYVSVFDLDVDIRSVASGTEIASPLAGTKPLAKQGAGTLVIDQAGAAAAGTIYVKEGALQIGNGGTTGSAGSPLAVTVSSGATLVFNRSDDYGGSFANAIGGAGGIEVKNGTVALAATNTYTGPTVVSGGTLSVGAGGALGYIPGNITNNSAVIFNRSNSTTYSGTISGSGSVAKQGAGTVTLAGNNTYSGPTRVQAGTLALSSTGALAGSTLDLNAADSGSVAFTGTVAGTYALGGLAGSRALAISSSASIAVGGNGATTTYSGALSGDGSLTKVGVGTLKLTGNNTFTGPTTVSQGNLQAGSAGALATSAVTVAAGATLSVGPQVQAVVPSLTNNGQVDLGLGRLTVTTGQTAEGFVTQIMDGIVNGGTTGITSTEAAATGGAFTVGWVDNFDGSYTASYAAAGDTNLDNVVDLTDLLNTVGSGFYDSGNPANWAAGDFNYDGVSDLTDLLSLVGGGLYDQGDYNPASLNLAPSLVDGGSGIGGVAAVPEPSTWGLAAMAAGTLLWLRRRRLVDPGSAL